MLGNEDGYSSAVVVAPSDSVNFTAGACHALYVGGTGNIVAIVSGVAITFNGAVAGTILRIRATRVNLTNTTATGLVALY